MLIQGDTGTGKELVAQAIHQNSPRKSKPFVALNCAALSENILESELFGHIKGAFTDASSDRVGKFEYAHGGTLFLDEVGDMPMATQIKLLRVLENGEFLKVGSSKVQKTNVRIVAATNLNMPEAIQKVMDIHPKMEKLLDSKAKGLSGGERQILLIGRALIGKPQLLLVDEPTEGLSPVMVKEVRDVLAEIGKSGISILLVEHNLKVAMSLADRVYLMGKAHLGFTGTVAELDANPDMRTKYLEV